MTSHLLVYVEEGPQLGADGVKVPRWAAFRGCSLVEGRVGYPKYVLPLALGGAEMPIDVQFLRLLPGLEIRSTSNPVVHTRTSGSFSAVSTPIFATK